MRSRRPVMSSGRGRPLLRSGGARAARSRPSGHAARSSSGHAPSRAAVPHRRRPVVVPPARLPNTRPRADAAVPAGCPGKHGEPGVPVGHCRRPRGSEAQDGAREGRFSTISEQDGPGAAVVGATAPSCKRHDQVAADLHHVGRAPILRKPDWPLRPRCRGSIAAHRSWKSAPPARLRLQPPARPFTARGNAPGGLLPAPDRRARQMRPSQHPAAPRRAT